MDRHQNLGNIVPFLPFKYATLKRPSPPSKIIADEIFAVGMALFVNESSENKIKYSFDSAHDFCFGIFE